MLKTDGEVFIQVPGETQERVLHRGRVCSISEEIHCVVFEETSLPLKTGMDIAIYYEIRRKFHQQAAVIQSVQTEPDFRVELFPIGDPVSAEGREYYRVSTISADVTATLESEANCGLRDISATGFAAVATTSHPLGAILPAQVHFEDVTYFGRVRVQSIRELPLGQIRYGFRYIDTEESGSELRDGLNQISLAVQREQLQRR